MVASGFLGGGLLWLSTNSLPETLDKANGYLATNLRYAGIAHPPQAIAKTAADHTGSVIGVVLLVIGALAALSWIVEFIVKRFKTPPRGSSDIGARVVIESTTFEPDPDDTARRIIKVEVKNMGPEPAYSGFCGSSYFFRDGMDEYPEADIDNNLTAVLDRIRSAVLNKTISDESGQTRVFQMSDRISEDAWQDVIHGKANLYIWTAYAYLDDKTIGDEIRVAYRVMRYHSGNGDGMAGTLIHQATRTLRAKAVIKMSDPNNRFDRLLEKMAPPSERKKPSADRASDAERDACCDETQTRQDTSKDASR